MSPLILAIGALSLSLPAPPQESPFLDGRVQIEGRDYGYRLLPPRQVVEGERYPLVLFLHGAGERGDDNQAQLRHFPVRMAAEEYRDRFPCFLLAPQCPEGAVWADGGRGLAQGGPMKAEPQPAMRAAIAAFEEVLGAHPIDRERIYLTGLSMGGAGTWDLAARHPEWFAAAVPICGGGDVRQAARLAGLPLAVWHGSDDRLIEPRRSIEMVQALRQAGGSVDYHQLDGVKHDSWGPAYAADEAVAWLFGHTSDHSGDLVVAQRAFVEAVGPEERVAFLGDSITEGGANPGGYVDLLRTPLAAARPEAAVIPAGISGHKVTDLLKRYRADVIEKDATLVFLYIGINDVWHHDWDKGTPIEEFEAGLRTLVRDFQASGAAVVLATPSVIGEKPLGENRKDDMLRDYAAVSRRVAESEGAVLCDLQRAFDDHLLVFNPDGAEKGILTTDQVHLNEAGNRLVAIEAAHALAEAAHRRAAADRTLRVFLLAGQSNMEGKGAVNTLDYLGEDPDHGHLLANLKQADGTWRVRDDVWIRFLEREGRLTTGFGSRRNKHGELIGPELGFGTVSGDHLDDPVLLIKTAWGGKDLANDFRSPSRGEPGESYKRMVELTRETLDTALERYPDCGAGRVELSGLVWFQGWNDMVKKEKTAAYADNLATFIRDVRTEFGRPNLPVVVGELGVGGPEAGGGVVTFRAAQEAAMKREEFAGNAVLARTADVYDLHAHELFEQGAWKGEDKDRYYRIASDRPYHYLGSAKIYYLMGHAFGEAMVELLPKEEN